MARRGERIFALVMALSFLVTTVGVAGLFIWQIHQDNQTKKQANAQTKERKMENFTPVAKVDKLDIKDLTEGTGDAVKAGDTVTVDYTGAVAATGVIFQSSLDTGQQATLSLDNVIPGWRDGIVGMKVGGTRRLLIPAIQAYGSNPPQGSGIPADADLVFDVTLHKIGK